MRLLPGADPALKLPAGQRHDTVHRDRLGECCLPHHIRSSTSRKQLTLLYLPQAVVVPGGQQYYVDRSGAVGFTQAHSAYVPPGATFNSFAAYENGAFVRDGPSSWVACTSTSAGGASGDANGRYALYLKTEANADRLAGCVGTNLLVRHHDGAGAWQYT